MLSDDHHDGLRSLSNDLFDGGVELRGRAGDNAKRDEVQRGAARWAPAQYAACDGLLSFNRMAMRRARGTTSCRIPISLPSTSSCRLVKPVMLPPGLARLATSPLPTASATLAMTIGIVFVARCAARGTWTASDEDHVDFLPDQFAGQGVQAVHVAIGVDESILDVLPFQPAEIVHSLLEGRAQMGTSGL